MNQILSTSTNNKKSNKASIKSILIVFSIMLILFGIGLLLNGAYSYYNNLAKNNSDNGLQVKTSNKPNISIEVEDSNSINIVVTHDKELSKVTYSINNEKETEIDTNGNKEVSQNVTLLSRTSKVMIYAEDINGISSSYEKDFVVEPKPNIKLDRVENKIQVTVESEIKIKTVQYYWDNDIDNMQTYEINDVKNVTLIEPMEDIHTLNIVATDIEGNKKEVSQKVKGDKQPEVSITSDGNKFIIRASDDEKLSKIEIILNSGEIISKEIDDKEYMTTVDLNLELDTNYISVTVYNINGISNNIKRKYSKQ